MNFSWNELAFASKKPVNDLRAAFIAAPRELSAPRFTQLVKEYLPKGDLVVGLAEEQYVLGLENQPQFRMLDVQTIQSVINKVSASASKHKIHTLRYAQRDLPHVLEKLKFRTAVFVNGSWRNPFHTQTPYHTLVRQGLPYRLVSPFADEAEAKAYAAGIRLSKLPGSGNFSEAEMLELSAKAATHSFDNGFQTGASLGRKKGRGYALLALAFNRVVPYQTYAMHFGAERETHFSPTNDLNYYDTTHAEVELLITALKEKINLAGATLFINLLPCPTCARMLSQTDIVEIVYREDHSSGYAVKMLELAGKKIRRVVV